MKKILFLLSVTIILTSWKADYSGPWSINESKRIVLLTRPAHYSKSVSPDSLTIQKILSEQEQVIDYINERLKTNFNSKVRIYLFNYDESLQKMGTSGGGFADYTKHQFCFTFNKPVCNTLRNLEEYIGVHEMVHVISLDKLGGFKTSFFAEGYSNAIDGNYGLMTKDQQICRQPISSSIIKIKEKGKFVQPNGLLNKDSNLTTDEYYVQIGCLMDWLFKTYGVEKMNVLFSVSKGRIPKRFLEITGERFEDMEKKYMDYQRDKQPSI